MTNIKEMVNQVHVLKQQGLSENQISDVLAKKGHSHTDIFDAMSQSKLGGNNMIPNNPQNSLPPIPNMNPMQPSMDIDSGMISATNEELIETIIEEKWTDLIKDINKIITWKNRTETKVTQIEQQIKDMKDQFDELHKAIIGKIGEYDKNILNVGAEVRAMEKVFSNVLPVFVNNVKQLNDISNKFKVVVANRTASKK